MYLHNKYTITYYNIIDRARQRNFDGYGEKHHIIPKSLDGPDTPENIVKLTAREHFLCHWLLTKMVVGQARSKMAYALMGMCHWHNNNQRRHIIPSRTYANLKKQMYHLVKNKLVSTATRKKMSLSAKRRSYLEAERTEFIYSRKGKKNTDDHKRKCSESLTGRKLDSKHRKRLSENHADFSGHNNPRAKTWKITSPAGEIYIVKSIAEFCKNNLLPATTIRGIGRGNPYPKSGACVGWEVIICS